jgi:DNA-nicking Smr family endonuclease
MKATDGREQILRFVEQYGVRDKDAGAGHRPPPSGGRGIAKNRKRGFRMTIDLHGMVSVDADRKLADALNECKKRGVKELLVIHGRGTHSAPSETGVLKKLVRENLEFRYANMVRGFGPALSRDGGEGATVVQL